MRLRRKRAPKLCEHLLDPAVCGMCLDLRLSPGDVVRWHGHRWGVIATSPGRAQNKSIDWWIEDEWVHQPASIDVVVEVDFEDSEVPDDVVARAVMYRLIK